MMILKNEKDRMRPVVDFLKLYLGKTNFYFYCNWDSLTNEQLEKQIYKFYSTQFLKILDLLPQFDTLTQRLTPLHRE